MRLQSVIIPDENPYAELYYRGNTALSSGGILTLDTYYNSFSHIKYREYTTVSEVSFSCRFIGKAKVELCAFDGAEHIICGGDFSEKAELSVKLSTLPAKGFLYPKFTALTDFSFEAGEYLAVCEPQKISCCIAICTYKRESYVLRNTELLRQFRFSFIDRVFVVDNGNTLDRSALSDDFIKVLPNRNYGGSGGFTRGLVEARDGGYTHVILMDDDVEFHPETLEQMTVFSSLLRESCRDNWISAGMIALDRPDRLFELGAEWEGKKAVVHKNNADILDRCVLVDNLDNPGVEYGGWWTLLMPVSITEAGLPYPFFIKFDDVEYGLRKPPDVQIMTMNGVSVRHEAFDRKKSFTLEYYNLRNELVVNAIYDKYNAFGAVRRFLYEAAKHLFLYRYDNIPLVFRAVNDFLMGTDFFLNCDEEQLNRELMNSAPRLVPLSELPEWSETLRCDEHPLNKKITLTMLLTLGGHLIPAFMLKDEWSAVPLSRTGAADCFGKKAVIQYQLGGDTGLITRRSLKKFVLFSAKTLGMTFKLLFSFNKAKASFKTRREEISSDDFWRRHLGLSAKK